MYLMALIMTVLAGVTLANTNPKTTAGIHCQSLSLFCSGSAVTLWAQHLFF